VISLHNAPCILILDDDANLRKTLGDILLFKGYAFLATQSGREALEQVSRQEVAVALIDLRLEDMNGLDVLTQIKAISSDTECILLTGYASQDSAIEAINRGAYSYVQKPADLEQLLVTLQRAVEKRAAVQSLRQLNAELEARVQQRTAELQRANRELEAFSYSVSHDLRAPLRAIQGYAGILLEDYTQILDDEGKRLLHVMGENVGKMDALIMALLNLSRVARSELVCHPVDMTSLAAEAYEALADVEIRQSFVFTLNHLPPANGDATLLRQVWFNLLSNAIKFTRTSPHRVIEVGAEPGGQENTYFVRDSGVGFNPQYESRLFGVFQRLHTSNEFEGIGIGLAIVQQVIDRHGGRIWAESQPGAGATFYFALPHE
jgi:signal transduction histidine kinase